MSWKECCIIYAAASVGGSSLMMGAESKMAVSVSSINSHAPSRQTQEVALL